MPPLPFVPGAIKISYKGGIGPGEWAVSQHYLYTGGPANDADCASLAGVAAAASWFYMKPQFPSFVSLQEVTVDALDSATAGFGSWEGFVSSSGSASEVPASASVLEKLSIARRYRGGHPRTYWPPMPGGNLSNATQWDPTATNNFTTALSNMRAQLFLFASSTLNISHFVSISYFSHGVLRVTPVTDQILSSAASQSVATQRRRLRRSA